MTEPDPSPRRRGRGTETAQIVVISWRDIPAQVNAQKGRDRQQVILPGKFQRAIDRAKRKARIYTAQEDIAQWNRASRPCGDDLAAEALAEAGRIEEAYTTSHLGRLGFLGGWEPGNKPADELLDETDDEDDVADEEGVDGDASDWGTWSTSPEEAARMRAQDEAATISGDHRDE